jgi:hypothetical protein
MDLCLIIVLQPHEGKGNSLILGTLLPLVVFGELPIQSTLILQVLEQLPLGSESLGATHKLPP